MSYNGLEEVVYISARKNDSNEDWQFVQSGNQGCIGGRAGPATYTFKPTEVEEYLGKLHRWGYETHITKLGPDNPGINMFYHILEDAKEIMDASKNVKTDQDRGYTADLQPPRK